MCKNSIHTTGVAASAVNELCTDRGSVCVTNSESTHDEPLIAASVRKKQSIKFRIRIFFLSKVSKKNLSSIC